MWKKTNDIVCENNIYTIYFGFFYIVCFKSKKKRKEKKKEGKTVQEPKLLLVTE